MPLVEINKFDGGHAEDIRTFNTDECEKSLNFDIFTNPHKLIPYPDSVAETTGTGVMADIQISDIDISLIGSSYVITGIGYETSISAKPTFWTKSAITNGGTLNWSSQAVSAGNTFQKLSGVVYKDKDFALGFNGSNQYTLYRYDSAGSVTAIGTISSSSIFYARPFVHPEDNILYIIIGTTITTWNGSALATTTTILPAGFEAVSVTDYGTYLAIGMRPLRGNGNSVTYLWGRDATINTLQGTIPMGEGNLLILENLDNELVAIMAPQNAFSTATTNKIYIKKYSGGSVQLVKSLMILNTQSISVTKLKNVNKLYFGLNNDYAVYAFGKNKEGEYILTQDRYYNNGTIIGSALYAIAMIGDVMWKGFGTSGVAYTLMRSLINSLGESVTYNSVSTYKTTINPNMNLSDRYKRKQLDAIQISYTGKANGTLALKYSVDGSAMTSIVSENTTAIETVKEANTEASTGKSLIDGREFQFQIESTGGVEIKEVRYRYTVLDTIL